MKMFGDILLIVAMSFAAVLIVFFSMAYAP